MVVAFQQQLHRVKSILNRGQEALIRASWNESTNSQISIRSALLNRWNSTKEMNICR